MSALNFTPVTANALTPVARLIKAVKAKFPAAFAPLLVLGGCATVPPPQALQTPVFSAPVREIAAAPIGVGSSGLPVQVATLTGATSVAETASDQHGCFPQYAVVAKRDETEITINTLRHKDRAPDGVCIVSINGGPEQESVWGMLPGTFNPNNIDTQAVNLGPVVLGRSKSAEYIVNGFVTPYFIKVKVLSESNINIDGVEMPATLISYRTEFTGSSLVTAPKAIKNTNYLYVYPKEGQPICYLASAGPVDVIYRNPEHSGLHLQRRSSDHRLMALAN